MRAAFSRIGSKISCDANTAGVALICAALIGRRVFVLVAVVLALSALAHRMRRRAPVLREVPEPGTVREAFIPPSFDAMFQPPRDFEATSVPDVSALHDALKCAIVGQRDAVEAMMIALLAGGHILLEGAPGLAKTFACRAMAAAIDGSFSRIQCTADLTPAEIVGCEVFDPRRLEFTTRLGPIFANVVLIDEINRTPARTQAALLEALEERRVTIGKESHALPEPFFVCATMNDAEPDGIYSLPAAQSDRFLLKAVLDFPAPDEELAILDRFGTGLNGCAPRAAVSLDAMRTWQRASAAVYCAPPLKQYIVDIVRATRCAAEDAHLERGAGPRATLAILRAARAKAILAGRAYALPTDIQGVARAALRHRVAFTRSFLLDRAEHEGRLDAILAAIPAP